VLSRTASVIAETFDMETSWGRSSAVAGIRTATRTVARQMVANKARH